MSSEKSKTIILTASENCGIGLWTSICVGFANVFGVESLNYKRKAELVIDRVKDKLIKQIISKPEYDFSNFCIVSDGRLSFTGTIIGTLNKDYKYVPPVSDDKSSSSFSSVKKEDDRQVEQAKTDENTYQRAMSLLHSKRFDEAKEMFLSLGSYKDSKERAKSCDILKQLYNAKVG